MHATHIACGTLMVGALVVASTSVTLANEAPPDSTEPAACVGATCLPPLDDILDEQPPEQPPEQRSPLPMGRPSALPSGQLLGAAESIHAAQPTTQPADHIAPCPDGATYCESKEGQVIDTSSSYGGPDPTSKTWLHGFRLGAIYVFDHDEPIDKDDPKSSLKERYDIDSPWMFAIGYEGMRRIIGHSWLNVMLVANVTVVGLEQSQFIPSANGLVGFEFDESFQLGVGVNITPEEEKPLHMIAAAGWTPKVGSFYMPVHITLVPDVDGNHRLGSTVGVNW